MPTPPSRVAGYGGAGEPSGRQRKRQRIAGRSEDGETVRGQRRGHRNRVAARAKDGGERWERQRRREAVGEAMMAAIASKPEVR